MRVLHLPYGIGISTLSKALRKKNVNATSVSFNSKNPYNYLADIKLNLNDYNAGIREKKRKEFFHKALKEFDIFHFHFGETFFPDKRDLKILRAKGKKLIVQHRGSEVRSLKKAQSFNNTFVKTKPYWTEEKIHQNLTLLSRYIQTAIVLDHELLPYVKKYYQNVIVLPRIIEETNIKPQFPDIERKPLVIHAPSNRELKGTEFILSAVKRLKDEGVEFDFKLIENLPRSEAMKLYSDATIVIDQLRIGAFGNFSLEVMAMGKPVICYIRPDLVNKYPPDLPIINANPDNIYQVLKETLKENKKWAEIGEKGRKYVEKHHNTDLVIKSLIKIYSKL